MYSEIDCEIENNNKNQQEPTTSTKLTNKNNYVEFPLNVKEKNT
jgi:hypothetical protein